MRVFKYVRIKFLKIVELAKNCRSVSSEAKYIIRFSSRATRYVWGFFFFWQNIPQTELRNNWSLPSLIKKKKLASVVSLTILIMKYKLSFSAISELWVGLSNPIDVIEGWPWHMRMDASQSRVESVHNIFIQAFIYSKIWTWFRSFCPNNNFPWVNNLRNLNTRKNNYFLTRDGRELRGSSS